MKFLALWFQPKNGTGPDGKALGELYRLFADMKKAGVLVDSGGWDPKTSHTVVRPGEGAASVSTEAPSVRENIVGYLLLEAATPQEAQQWCTRWAGLAGEGHCELWQVPG